MAASSSRDTFATPTENPNCLTSVETQMTERAFKVMMNKYCRRNNITYEFDEYTHTIENIPVQFDTKLDYVNLYFRTGHFDFSAMVGVPFISPADLVKRIRDYKMRLTNVQTRKENCPPVVLRA